MRLKSIATVILFALSSSVMAQMQIPVDKDVRIGKLSNGLTYYIRYNNWPENRANFYIAQKVGSIQEEESQRGLAHFLEHMAFNGSDHFKGNNLIEWCRSKGIEFGGDLNAYTSIDQTVYNINNVPTEKVSITDSCLLILRDWSTGLTLDSKEIDKERGVIHEEWRLRTSAQSRMFERDLPLLYPGSKYGLRFPIGLMSVVDNFTHKELVDYYRKWYHPSHQGIIIVGDIDVDKTEQKIKELFGDIKNPANEAKITDEPVPDNAAPIVIIDKDKEQTSSDIDLLFKHDIYPDSLKGDIQYLAYSYIKQAGIGMLNERYTEAAQKKDCPFISSGVADDNYIFAKTKDAFYVSSTPKDSSLVAASCKAALVEVYRAARFGFTATEYNRFKQNAISALDKAYSNKDKRYNDEFYNEYKANFLSNEPIPGIDDYYRIMTQMVNSIPLDAVNSMFKSLVPKNDSNMVVINFNHENANNIYPKKENIIASINEAKKEDITAYIDNVKNEPLIKNLPTAGTIKKEIRNDKLGYTKLILSNGVNVILKKTDYKKDQVSLSGTGDGGSSLYGEVDYTNINAFNDAISYSGLGNFSSTELQKALTGKIANANLKMGQRKMSIDGYATPKDVETMLQMTYLYFTNIKKDQESFNTLLSRYEAKLKNRELSPDIALGDTLQATLYNHNPRLNPMLKDDIKDINYDRILQIAKERTASARGWDFIIIGNYNDTTIRQMVCQYLGALPAKGKPQEGKRYDYMQQGIAENVFKRKMETPKDIAYIIWHNENIPYSLEKSVQIDIAGQILSMVYLQKIREDASAAYYCGADGGCSLSDDRYHVYRLLGYCPMKPEKREIAIKIMNEAAEDLKEHCDEESLDKVKELMLKQADDNAKTNDYWFNVIGMFDKLGINTYSDYNKIVEAQTSQTITTFMKEFFNKCNKTFVVMIGEQAK